MLIRLNLIVISLFFISPSFSQNWSWVRQISGTANDTGYSIDIDDDGFVFVTGRCKQPTTFEDNSNPIGPLTIGDRDVFISKYSPVGELMWAQLAGTDKAPYYDQGYDIVGDNQGGCYVVGIFNDTSFFGNDTLISQGARDAFICHTNSNGEFLWSKGFGGINDDYAKGLDVDSNGDILVSGSINGLITIEGYTIGTANQSNGYVFKYNSNGDLTSLMHLNSQYKSSVEKIKSDNQNNIYITGSINGTGIINGTTITNPNSVVWNDMFAVKLDSNFDIIWHQTGGGSYYDLGSCISTSSTSVYIGGTYSSIALFDTITSTFNSTSTGTSSNQSRDAFVAAYSQEGDIKWFVGAGNEGIDEITGITASKNGSIYVSGFYRDSITFIDSTLYAPANSTNGFVAKLDTIGNLIWIKNIGNTNDTRAYNVKIDEFENIFIVGDYTGSISFDNLTHTSQNRDAFGGKILQPPSPSYKINNSTLCIGDTLIIEMTGITSPLTYSYQQTDQYTSWSDSIHIFYIINTEPTMNITGIIQASNTFYTDSILLNIQLNTFPNFTPFLINDTTLCFPTLSLVLSTENTYNSYLWSNNIENNTNSTIVNTTGEYSLTASNSDGCEGQNNVFITFSDCLNLNKKIQTNNILFSTSTNTLINTGTTIINNLEIINITGQRVLLVESLQIQEQIDISHLPQGTYLIVTTDEIKKIIITY